MAVRLKAVMVTKTVDTGLEAAAALVVVVIVPKDADL